MATSSSSLRGLLTKSRALMSAAAEAKSPSPSPAAAGFATSTAKPKPSEKKAAPAAVAPAPSGGAASKGPSRRGSGIMKPVPVSPQLGKFLGADESSRAGAVKKVWDHIKLNNLQDATNKRVIHCDEKLKTIFDGKDKVEFLEVSRLLSQHFRKPDA